MRNLKLLGTKVVRNVQGISEALYIAFDSDVGIVYAATKSHVIAFSPESEECIGSISVRESQTDENCVPVSLQYVCDQQALCIAFSDGRMCLWQLATPEELECVGEVEGGITAMSWSPDLELVVVTSGHGKMLLMTREFDVIMEVPLFPDSDGEESNISVGWGKKETQFHGSAGKQAAKVEQISVHPAGDEDRGQPLISWRGDGLFFVVSAIDPDTRGRFLYVWSRECVFQARSEPVDGLQHALFWKPSGSLIASIQKKSHTNTQDVVFFEKNGLRHGEFTIPSKTGVDLSVVSIMWNSDSAVLALWISDISKDATTCASHLQLWTVNNYHWYLKQSLQFNCGLAAVSWDTEHAYKMHVITKDGQYLAYTWAWTTDHTSGSDVRDLALVGVIDGAQVLMTPMRQMVVPPPMAAFTLTLSHPANALTFNPSPGANGLAVLTSSGELAVYSYPEEESKTRDVNLDAAGGDGFISQCDLPSLEGIYKIHLDKTQAHPLAVSHLLWLPNNQFVFSTLAASGLASELHLGEISSEEKAVVIRNSFPLESFIFGIALNEATMNVAIQLNTGDLLKFIPESQSLLPWTTAAGEAVKFPYPCTEMAVTTVGGEEVVLGLTDRFRFYVNAVEVASNCTSFGSHNEFLLLTTLSHTLRCICRSTKLSELPKLSDGKAHPFDESIRRVERGSRIVTVVGSSTKLVLQMPRGNLETVHPRALVLSALKHLLDSDKILEAFLLMRKHRINLNLLHDHNPTHFLENIEDVIRQIQNPSYFNVFLTDLIEDDVTRTMYTASYQREPIVDKVRQEKSVSKVDKICNAFLAAFMRLGDDSYLQCILTAHVRKTKPELEEALLLVWSLHGKTGPSTAASAEDALKYLLFLVDVNALYDVALGTYNFDLVMMVAQKSQKDPKEYIPFLNELRRLEENYRYYTIDKHLKKYSKALEHITKCGDEHFEECVTLVSDHKLHSKALRLYKPGSVQFRRLATLYGNYLRTKNRHDEAGIMFIKAEEWELALEAFRAAHEWRQVFCVAAKLEYNGNRLSELAVKVAGELKNRQRYNEAAAVLQDYAQDTEEAIVALIEGSHWEEALRLMHRFKRLDLIETHLREALVESSDHHLDMLITQREQFDRHKSRLAVVRAQKEKAKADLLEGLAEHNDAEADLFSDTTSMTGASVSSLTTANSSRSTVFTKNTGSSRTRRKAENKKWSLKEGSANEEYALVDALAKIIKTVDSLKEDTSSLMKMLIQFNFDEKASNLQEQYSDLLDLIQASISEIWVYAQGSQTNMNLGPNTTANAIAQAMQRGQKLQGGEEEKLDPVLLVPPTLNKETRWKLHMASDQDR